MFNKSLIFLALTLTFVVSGCVSKTTYQLKVDEANQLTARVGDLETELQLMGEKNGYLSQRNGELDQRLREALNRGSALDPAWRISDLVLVTGTLSTDEKNLTGNYIAGKRGLSWTDIS